MRAPSHIYILPVSGGLVNKGPLILPVAGSSVYKGPSHIYIKITASVHPSLSNAITF